MQFARKRGSLMMSVCEFTKKCPIFNKFRHERVRDFWIDSYCRRDGGTHCERKKLRMAGSSPEEVPITLLPNGMHLVVFAENQGDWEEVSGKACDFVEHCAVMFDRFQDPESKKFWGGRYCFFEGGRDCRRREMMQGGTSPEDVPPTLLPSGDHLPTLVRG